MRGLSGAENISRERVQCVFAVDKVHQKEWRRLLDRAAVAMGERGAALLYHHKFFMPNTTGALVVRPIF